MPLILKYLPFAVGILLIINVMQCSRAGTLQERIGEERQKCETSFARAEAAYQAELTEVERESAKQAAAAVALLTIELQSMAQAKHKTELSRRETETRLALLMGRLNEEDQEWGDVLLPSYLLSP